MNDEKKTPSYLKFQAFKITEETYNLYLGYDAFIHFPLEKVKDHYLVAKIGSKTNWEWMDAKEFESKWKFVYPLGVNSGLYLEWVVPKYFKIPEEAK